MIELPPRTIQRRVIEGIAEAPYSNVTVKIDVPRSAFNFLKERKDEFPGVDVEKLYLRAYPHKELAAQLFGTLREISPKELKKKKYRGVAAGTRIGAGGIEQAYDRYLRGQDGFTRVVINALGNRDDTREVTRREPRQGQRLRLTLDLGLERAANNALKQAIAAANGNGNPAKAGAYVALDPTNGEVLALGSYPSFDANLFAKPLSQEKFDALNSEENGAPLFNRAIAAAYPTGSTFKPITAMAALEAGILTPTQTIFDDGEFKLGPQTFRNARNATYGPLNLPRALKVSSDVFFYTLGERANSRGPIIQDWARTPRPRPPHRDRPPRRVRRPRARSQVARRRLRQVPEVRQAREGPRPDVRGAEEVRRHRAAVVHGRQRQPLGRPGRPAGDAAADGDRLLGDRQRRARRAAAPGDERRGRPGPRGRGVPHHRQAPRQVLRDRPGHDHAGPARARPRSPAARRPTCSRASPAGSSPSTARPVPWSGRGSPTSPGTPATCPIPAARSSSSPPSRRAASAPRRPRRPRA